MKHQQQPSNFRDNTHMPSRYKLKQHEPGATSRYHNHTSRPNGKKPQGRPTAYKPEYDRIVYHMRLLGATVQQMADFFEINPATLYLWRNAVPSFDEAWRQGGILADGRVAQGLWHRAVGYSHPEEKLFLAHEDGVAHVIRAETIKHYPPDSVAAIKWLAARQPEIWRERTVSEITGPNGQPLGLPPIIVVRAVSATRHPVIEGEADEV